MGDRLRVLADAIAKRNPIKDPAAAGYSRSGQFTADVILAELHQRFAGLTNLSILDFGCGAGRVAAPLARLLPDSQITAIDVDVEAVEYLVLSAPPNCTARVTPYNPPLQFADQMFDAIYALSVWSHFPEDLGFVWLQELRRISKPGGLILISVGGANTLEAWKRQGGPWSEISSEDLTREKFIYREFKGLKNATKQFPGIAGEGSWGNAAIHPAYIRSKWGPLFEDLEVRERGMPGGQDLVILKNPEASRQT